MTGQAQLGRARSIRPSLAAPAQPFPFPAVADEPQVILSPQAPAGGETTGFQWMLGDPGLGDIDVVIWKRDPVSTVWGVLVAQATYAAFYWQTVGCMASELYFELPGYQNPIAEVRLLVEETSGVSCTCGINAPPAP